MRMTGNAREDARALLMYVLENDGKLGLLDLRKAVPGQPQYIDTIYRKLRGQKVLKSNGKDGLEVDLNQALGKNYLKPTDVELFRKR